MKKLNIIVFLSVLFTFQIDCQKSDLQSYIKKWDYLASIEGQLFGNNTLLEDLKCNPCIYLIILYEDYLQLLIQNQQNAKVKGFELDIQHDAVNFMNFDSKNTKIISKNNQKIHQKISRLTRNGLQWKYQFTLPIQGVIIKGQTLQNQLLIPLVSLIFGIFIIIYLPLRKNSGHKIFSQLPQRTPLLSLLILSQLQHTILIQLLTLGIKYIIWQDLFLVKVLWYAVFMVPLSFLIIQIIYIYDSIKKVYFMFFQNQNSIKIKEIGLLMVLFIGIYFTTILLLYITKFITVFYYFSLFYLFQFISSLKYKKYFCLKINVYCLILICFVMILANLAPLYWFQLLKWRQIIIYLIYLLIFISIGCFLQYKLIKVQHISNNEDFQLSKQIQLDQNSKNTEQNLQKWNH